MLEKLKKINWITYIFNLCINGYPVPEEQKTAYIISIYKDDRKLCENYRGISLASIISKYMRIPRDLIKEEIKGHEEEQSGVHAGRTYNDKIFCLKQIT